MVVADRQSRVSLMSAAPELMSAAPELMSAAPEAVGDSGSSSSEEAAGWQAEPSSENESNTESDHAEASRVRLREALKKPLNL